MANKEKLKVEMKPWFQTSDYEKLSADNKIAAWADHCRDIEYERDVAQQALREAIAELDARNQGYWDLEKLDRWSKAAGLRSE